MENTLKALKWSKAELARRLGVLPSTVTDWGDQPPSYATAYLMLAIELKAVKELVSVALERTR